MIEAVKHTANKPNEYSAFSEVLGKVLKASHKDVQQKLEAERKQKKPAKKQASCRVSSDKG